MSEYFRESIFGRERVYPLNGQKIGGRFGQLGGGGRAQNPGTTHSSDSTIAKDCRRVRPFCSGWVTFYETRLCFV
jgi:hypothetical protein